MKPIVYITLILLSIPLIFGACKKNEKQVLMPEVTTENIENIKENSATVTGMVVKNGGGQMLQKGICWGQYENPTLNDSYIKIESKSNKFNITINYLAPGKKYFARAFVQNSKGISYGNNIIFTTPSKNIAAITMLKQVNVNAKKIDNTEASFCLSMNTLTENK